MTRSRIQIAKADIVSHFDALPHPVLKLKEIRAILSEQRAFWRLAQSTKGEQLIEFLENHAKLNSFEFAFPQRTETCYTWGDVPLLTILLAIKKDVHFSHYTAMRVHGLTEQTPTSIYLTDERKIGYASGREKLEQGDIDRAFKQAPKISHNWVEHAGKKIYLLNGADTGHLGVITKQVNDDDGKEAPVRVTNLERTLIDITVRPTYAGGAFEVAKAFELAKNVVSVNKLVSMLLKLNYAYPYHQAIGYYLERAAYKPSQIDLIRRLPIQYDFYLTHAMNGTRYLNDWRLFVPNGF